MVSLRKGWLAVALAFTCYHIAAARDDNTEILGTVTRVVDGDDMQVCASEGACVRIRLCGIDAPEHYCTRFAEATKALRDLAEGKQVRCVQVGAGTPCDGRSRPTNGKRIIAQCFVDDFDIATVLVDRGLACDWTKFSGGYYARNRLDRACPKDHRRRCAGVLVLPTAETSPQPQRQQ